MIFRLITLGLERLRREGLRRCSSITIALSHLISACFVITGGKIAPDDAAAGDRKGGSERDPVRIVSEMSSCFSHKAPDSVVAAEMSPDLLVYELRGFRPQDCAWPPLVGIND